MNTIILMGELVRIRPLGETTNGTPALTAHIRVPLESERRSTETFLTVSAYGKLAVDTSALREGTTVIVEGALVAYRLESSSSERVEVRAKRLTVVSAGGTQAREASE